MAKKTSGGIDWKALESKKGTIVSTGTGANVIVLEKDEFFIGKFKGTETIQIGENDPFVSLQFETKEGEQCISGSQLVQQMRMVNVGSIVKVTKTGKKKTGGGYKVGTFTVELLDGSINEKAKEAIKKEIQEAVAKKNKKKGKKK